jgi:hypothetical protein
MATGADAALQGLYRDPAGLLDRGIAHARSRESRDHAHGDRAEGLALDVKDATELSRSISTQDPASAAPA